MAARLERTIIGAHVGAADIGEALATAAGVAAGDYERQRRRLTTGRNRRGGGNPPLLSAACRSGHDN
ncbi:MAG TPA: hypothetical protein VKJ07_13915, partial [Mycobacteriales bacterium]|nr:hypothetical protein [Mycobacteriales bacterium]